MTVDERFVFDVRVLIDQGLTPEGVDAVRGALAHSGESNLCTLASAAISARLSLIAVHRVKDEGGVDAIAWSPFRRLTMDQLNRAKGLSNRGYRQSNRYPRASDVEAPQMAASERFRAEGAAAGFCLRARHGPLRVGFHRSLLGEQLLAGGFSLITARANFGKTMELRACAQRLRGEGQHAVFVALHRLLEEPDFHIALEATEAIAFGAWEAEPTERLHLFVDSLDEAVLGRESGLQSALRRVSRAVGRSGANVSWILSSRPATLTPFVLEVVQAELGATLYVGDAKDT